MIAGVVLAGGGSTRFGSPKQLAQLDGRPLLEHALGAVRSVPAIERIIVVLGAEAELISDAIDFEGCEVVVAEDWDEGISASLRAGVAALPDADAVVVTLADQPLITPQVIAAVLEHADRRAPAARATFGGAPGHPVLIKRELFADVMQLRGDSGARELLELSGVATIECGNLASADDVDTTQDLQRIGGQATNLEVHG